MQRWAQRRLGDLDLDFCPSYDTETQRGRQSSLSSTTTKIEKVMFVFLLEGGDVGQPLVHCVLSWLRDSFNLWSAGLCVFEVKRCWPREDPQRETLVQSWGFLRLVHEPTNLHVVSNADSTHSLETGTRPRTVMIAVEMTVALCRATARWITVATSSVQEGTLLVLGRQPEVQTWEGNALHRSCSAPHNDFSVPNYFQREPLPGATVQPPNFWHGERWPVWDTHTEHLPSWC